jgi:hypothetical protein
MVAKTSLNYYLFDPLRPRVLNTVLLQGTKQTAVSQKRIDQCSGASIVQESTFLVPGLLVTQETKGSSKISVGHPRNRQTPPPTQAQALAQASAQARAGTEPPINRPWQMVGPERRGRPPGTTKTSKNTVDIRSFASPLANQQQVVLIILSAASTEQEKPAETVFTLQAARTP